MLSSVVVVLGGGVALSIKPKKLEFDSAVGCRLSAVGFVWFSSTKPSSFVDTMISFFGILTTPLFWSSRRSIISFFFLPNIMELVRVLGIKIFGVERFIYL